MSENHRYSENGGPARSRSSGERRTNARPAKKKRRFSKGARFSQLFIIVAVVIGISFFLAIFGLQAATDLFGLNQKDRTIEVTIPFGSTTGQIAKILDDAEVITHPGIFKMYSSMKKSDVKFKAGIYSLNSNMSFDEIIIQLRTGNVSEKVEKRITFYEGMPLREIAQLLEENFVCSSEEFIEYLNSNQFDFDFYGSIPEEEFRYYKLEGYVFPDTYDFFENEAVESVANKFLVNFENRISDELLDRMQEMGMTLDETLTLASIIQAEANSDENMALVSSVFHNRLDSGDYLPLLQSDVTIFYIEDELIPVDKRNDDNYYAAYNTYERRGLPVGPVCNPGLAAIKAALYPADSDYYFFVTDITGKYYYSVTFEEHEQNVYTASQVGEIHGTGVTEE